MARINIEDSLFKDSRFIDLMIKIGDKDAALGKIVRAFIVAQSHYLSTDNDRLIPKSEWKKQGCSDDLLDVGLAEEKKKGIYVFGSDDQFKWLLQRQNAGKSPKRQGSRPGETVDDRSIAVDNRNESVANGSNPLSLSLSPSLSLTHNHSTNSNKKNASEFDWISAFEDSFNLYKKSFPGKSKGPSGPKFKTQIKNEKDLALLKTCIANYKSFLDEQFDKTGFDQQPRSTFASFLGSKRSGYFWREFEEPRIVVPRRTKNQEPEGMTAQELKNHFEAIDRGDL